MHPLLLGLSAGLAMTGAALAQTGSLLGVTPDKQAAQVRTTPPAPPWETPSGINGMFRASVSAPAGGCGRGDGFRSEVRGR